MDGDNLDQERRLIRLESTVAWMRWLWVTLGGAALVSAVGYVFTKL